MAFRITHQAVFARLIDRVGDTALALPEIVRTGAQEPGIVPLADGRLWMFMRTDQGVQYQSYSTEQVSNKDQLSIIIPLRISLPRFLSC